MTNQAAGATSSEPADGHLEHQTVENASTVDPLSRRMGGFLRAAAVTAGIWWLALILLAFATANPVTLNRVQILSATAVITGKVVDAETGTVQVVQQFHGPPLPSEIVVEDLADAGAKTGDTYLLPLAGIPPGSLQIEPSRLPGQPPLIYPASQEAIDQLTELRSQRVDSTASAADAAAFAPPDRKPETGDEPDSEWQPSRREIGPPLPGAPAGE